MSIDAYVGLMNYLWSIPGDENVSMDMVKKAMEGSERMMKECKDDGQAQGTFGEAVRIADGCLAGEMKPLTEEELRRLKEEIKKYPLEVNRMATPKEPEHDYQLVTTHVFESIFAKMDRIYEDIPVDFGQWTAQYENLFMEKIVWIFVCRKTGQIKEISHSGPIEHEGAKE